MTQHTPGPWIVRGPIQVTPKSRAWKVLRGKYSTEVRVDGDAHLIAAAPDLLKAARELAEVLEKANALGDEYEWDPIAEVERLRAVIAKATGA